MLAPKEVLTLKREKSSGLGAGGQSRVGGGALGWVPNSVGCTSSLCRHPAYSSHLICTTTPAAGIREETDSQREVTGPRTE